MWPTDRTTALIVGVCAVVWLICAIQPWDFPAWLLEQFATLCALIVLGWCIARGIRFTITSKISIGVFFIVHTIGTHFTYSVTPYDAFFQAVAGISINDLLGFERNHYDRFVHFMYGVCLALPAAQALQQRLHISTFTARFLAVHIILSTSALYELVEWGAAILFGGDLGTLYLGTQGDVWDAQADIALATVGQFAVYALCGIRAFLARSVRTAAS